MKRCLAVLGIIVIFLCGCKENKNSSPKLKGISFLAEISYDNEKMILKSSIDQEGTAVFTVVKPQDFKDLSFTFKGDKVTAEFMGISYTPKSGSLPANHIAEIIHSAFSDAQKRKMKTEEGKNSKIEGEIKEGEYTLSLSPGGFPLRLKTADGKFTARFSSLVVI